MRFDPSVVRVKQSFVVRVNCWLSSHFHSRLTTQVVKTSVTVNNSAIQDYVHPDNHAQPTFEQGSHSLEKSLNFRGSPLTVLEFSSALNVVAL